MPFDRSTPEADAPEFEIGVCDEAFNVYARIVMRGAEVKRIENDLSEMGYDSISIGTTAQRRGCDLLVVRRAVEAELAVH